MGKDDTKKKEDKKKKEHNPRWKGYLLLSLTSVVCFASAANVSKSLVGTKEWRTSVSFGAVSFTICILLNIVDRAGWTQSFNFDKLCDGKAEGTLLICFVLWWIIGVGYMTRVGGIAYRALNIYFSSWLSLAATLYTLNKWSSAKDILTIHELTRLSATLKSWWILLISSLVTFAAAADAYSNTEGAAKDDTALGISFGVFSSIISTVAILEHYNMCCFSFVKHGGLFELAVAILMILIWSVGVSVLTKQAGIAATISGSNSDSLNFESFPRGKNCSIIVVFTEDDGGLEKIESFDSCDFVPGSNLYLSSWTCLIASLAIAARWKAAQAIQFAHAQNSNILGDGGAEMEGNDDDDIGDIDAFEDAAEDTMDAI